MRSRTLLLIVAAAVISMLLAACAGSTDPAAPDSGSAPAAAEVNDQSSSHMDSMHDDGHMDATHGDGSMMAMHDVPAEAAAMENPLPASDEVRLAGATTFQETCATCHGESGQGDGPAASGLQYKPANLTTDHVQALSDGALFYIVTQGRPERGMPSWEEGLSEQERWQVIRYLRTLAQ